MEGKFISYIRVSTDKQGVSGLGLEAQRKAITDYLNGGNWKLVKEFKEIESGKRDDNRPMLKQALDACKRTGSKLLIAKLDRLSRNVAFIANLMESDVDFVAVDFPNANRLTVHILAAVAEHEREMISKRTKEALKVAKTRLEAEGKRLGNPNGLSEAAAKNGRGMAVQSRKRNADNHASRIYGVIKEYQSQGMSLNAIARGLHEEQEQTPRGKGCNWTPTAVRRVLERVEGKK